MPELWSQALYCSTPHFLHLPHFYGCKPYRLAPWNLTWYSSPFVVISPCVLWLALSNAHSTPQRSHNNHSIAWPRLMARGLTLTVSRNIASVFSTRSNVASSKRPKRARISTFCVTVGLKRSTSPPPWLLLLRSVIR